MVKCDNQYTASVSSLVSTTNRSPSSRDVSGCRHPSLNTAMVAKSHALRGIVPSAGGGDVIASISSARSFQDSGEVRGIVSSNTGTSRRVKKQCQGSTAGRQMLYSEGTETTTRTDALRETPDTPMTHMPTHIRRRDLIDTAWIQALAYASTVKRSHGGEARTYPRAWAIATFPAYLTIQAALGHRNLYTPTSGTGVIGLCKTPPWAPTGRGLLAATLLLIAAKTNPAATGVVVLLMLASMTTAVLGTGNTSKTHEPAPKPGRGKRVTFALAARHPDGRKGEVLRLGRRIINALPPGTLVTVHPRTDEL